MAIEFNCPYCQEPHRLKNEYAGKRALCKNPSCRQVVVIPKPVTVPADEPPRTSADLEAAALSALADEPAAQEKGPAEQVIPMTCTFCEHKWTEPISRAGKNVLCQNPECRQRQKVPEPKTDQPVDWRQTRTKLPSLAKGNFEKLEGVEDAGAATTVTGEALRQAGATGVEIEPRTLKQKLTIAFSAIGLLLAVAGGVWYLVHSRTVTNENTLIADARKEFDEAAQAMDSAEAGLGSAILATATGEYELRGRDKVKDAETAFSRARKDLSTVGTGLVRNAVAAELAATVIDLGGTEEEVKRLVRIRWVPDLKGGARKVNEKQPDVFNELLHALQPLQAADPGARNVTYDYRLALARRLTGELAKRGQSGLAADNLPQSLFDPSEKAEAQAVVALELFRLEPGSEVAKRMAAEVSGAPRTPFVQTVLVVIGGEAAPPIARAGTIAEADRAVVAIALLKGSAEDAVKLALRHTTPESQLRSLALCAEWSAPPAAALDEARKVLEASRGKRDVSFSPFVLLRLSQTAAAAGWLDQAKGFAGAIGDDGLRAWAQGDAVRWWAASRPKEKVEESALELPQDPKGLKAGHCWGLYWIARHNATISGDRAGERKATANWPGPAKPFGLAGIALGLVDR